MYAEALNETEQPLGTYLLKWSKRPGRLTSLERLVTNEFALAVENERRLEFYMKGIVGSI